MKQWWDWFLRASDPLLVIYTAAKHFPHCRHVLSSAFYIPACTGEVVGENRRVTKNPFWKQEPTAKLIKSDSPCAVKWVVFSPSIHPCLPPPLALVSYSPFGCIAFKMGAWQCANNWGKRKSRESTHVAVIAVNLCSAFYMTTLLAVCLPLAGFLHCQMLLCRRSLQYSSSLQLPSSPSCLGRAGAPFPPSSQLLSCWSSQMTAMQKYAW